VQQTLLAKAPDAPLRVYAVWFKMYPGDARERWRPELLGDVRVRHYWDEERFVGRGFLQVLPRLWALRAPETVLSQADALWDAYLLYRTDARWDEEPPTALSWGATILQTQETLQRDIAPLLKN